MAKAKPAPEYDIVQLDDAAAWSSWLASHHASVPGVWLRFGRKASPLKTVTYDEAVEVALCFGWIDGQSKSYDAESWLQKFTPRGRRSVWSQINCDRAERLIREGRMEPAGLAAIEAAKADGRWERAYASPANAATPPDFEAAMAAKPKARAFWETLGSSKRYPMLHRIQTAVKPETRARRIEQFVAKLEQHETL